MLPEDFKGDNLPFFIDGLKDKVVLVEIVAYAADNTYTILQTMNDRGLKLTPTEVLKGFILSQQSDWLRTLNVCGALECTLTGLHWRRDKNLFYRDAFGEVAGLVHGAAGSSGLSVHRF